MGKRDWKKRPAEDEEPEQGQWRKENGEGEVRGATRRAKVGKKGAEGFWQDYVYLAKVEEEGQGVCVYDALECRKYFIKTCFTYGNL